MKQRRVYHFFEKDGYLTVFGKNLDVENAERIKVERKWVDLKKDKMGVEKGEGDAELVKFWEESNSRERL